MSTATTTAVDALKLALRDRLGSFLSDSEYEQCLLSRVAPEATYQARRISPGYWVVPSVPLCLFAAGFDEEPAASYELCCGGFTTNGAVSIKLTAGSDVRVSIDVTGCVVSFNDVLADLLELIATTRAQEYSQSIGSGSISPQTARAELLEQASVLRGVLAV